MIVYFPPRNEWFRGRRRRYTHLASTVPGAEGTRELRTFGRRIGLDETWLYEVGGPHEHFHIVDGRIPAARAAGAVEVVLPDFVRTTSHAKRIAMLEAGGPAAGARQLELVAQVAQPPRHDTVSPYWSTDEVALYLRLSSDVVLGLVRDYPRPTVSAWRLYSGELGSSGARFRWHRNEVDPWFSEVCAWRVSRNEVGSTGSDGATAGATEPTDRSRSAPNVRPTGSGKRSKKVSNEPDDTSLADLAVRLRSASS